MGQSPLSSGSYAIQGKIPHHVITVRLIMTKISFVHSHKGVSSLLKSLYIEAVAAIRWQAL